MTLFHESPTFGETSQSQDSLDEEFRQILYLIKPYILRVTNRYHIKQYQVWLERLSDSSAEEKFERNKYLVELANLIQDGTLKAPFTANPPRGSLSTLSRETQSHGKLNEIGWTSKRTTSTTSTRNPSKHQFHKFKTVNEETSRTVPDGQLKNDQPQKKKLRLKTFQKIGTSKLDIKKVDESSSWCDLTDGSEASNEVDNKPIASKISFSHTNEGKKLKEHYMKEYKAEITKSQTQSIMNSKSTSENEVNLLKQRIKDLIDVKNAIKDTHFLTEDRKKTMESLQARLIESEETNMELRSMVDSQNTKIKELGRAKSKAITEFKENFTNLRNKELEILKTKYREDMSNRDKIHQAEIDEVRKQLQKQIDDLKVQHEKAIEQKNKDIARLKTDLEAKNPQSEEQINHLKRCVSKLDKMLQKTEKDYLKKIEKLKQELEVKDMTAQVQLQTQRAEILLRTSATKQEEFNNAVNSLEMKYRTLLEAQMQPWLSSERNEKILGDLQEILSSI